MTQFKAASSKLITAEICWTKLC